MAGTTLIHARYVLPVRPAGVVLERHTVVVVEDRIVAVLPTDAARADYPGAAEIALGEHVLMPGLINAHTHSPMTLLRGVADDQDMQAWLREYIWPLESRFVGPDFVSDGTRLAIAEMLHAGTTCFNELYFFPGTIAEVVHESGVRACVGVPIIEMTTPWAADVGECFDRGVELLDRFGAHPRVSFSFGPHAPYTVSDTTLERIGGLARERDLPVHMHVLETAWEARHSRQEHGIGTLRRLERHGLLSDRLLAVHMTQLDDDDIRLLGERKVNVVHCPESNLKLASGVCPVSRLRQAGVNVAVGTDGAASNNDLDLLGEVRSAALLAKGLSADARAVPADAALDMLTINAARALGQGDSLGSIEPGKLADLAALDLRHARTQPVHDVVSAVIYSAASSQFTDVWVGGERVLADGRLRTFDEAEVLAAADAWRARLASGSVKTRPTQSAA